MADINYNEVTHSVVYTDGATVGPVPDPMFHWDVRFPNRFSRLNLSPEFSRISLGLGLTSTVGSGLSPAGRRQNRRARAADRSGGGGSGGGGGQAAPGRYRTQPITFDEIAEVDEDGGPANVGGNSASPAADATVGLSGGAVGSLVLSDAISKESKVNFKTQMVSFSRSMDGLMPGYVQRATNSGGVLTGSDKENTPCEPDFVTSAYPNMVNENDQSTGTGSGLQVAAVADELAAALAGFQMPTAIADTGRLRRKRSNRKLRNRNSVPEEVTAEQLGTDCGANSATSDSIDHDASG